MMRELRRYRLFLTFLLVPLFIVVLIVILVINTVFADPGDGEVEVTIETPAAVATAAPPVATDPAPDPQPPTLEPAPQTPAPAPTAAPTTIPPIVATPSPAPAPAPAPAPTSACAASVYTVQPGDTLFDIALRFGVTVDAIVNCNGISDPGQIAAGDELQIPAAGDDPAPAPDTTIVATVSTGGAQLNVRDAPSLSNSQVVTQLADGDAVQLSGQRQLADGVTWYETANGNWLHGDYLTLP